MTINAQELNPTDNQSRVLLQHTITALYFVALDHRNRKGQLSVDEQS